MRSTHQLVRPEELDAIVDEWDALASNPFVTVAWLRSWHDVWSDGRPIGVVVRDDDGSLAAGAWLPVPRRGDELWAYRGIAGWGVPARDEGARATAYAALLRDAPAHVRLAQLPVGARGTATAREALAGAGYRVIERAGDQSPFLTLPPSMETLLASVSRNLRSQTGRRRRALEKQGELRLATHTDGTGLDAFLALEASGWKARNGSALASVPAMERQFRLFAARAAPRGQLRVHLLELDGRPIAADCAVVLHGTAYLLKTGFDEAMAPAAPGVVLRAMVLEEMIREGCTGYDFLGDADSYKTRWGAEVRPKVILQGHRGVRELPRFVWQGHVRPAIVPIAKRVLRREAKPARP